MALIKKSEFKQMNEPQMNGKLNELKKELMRYNAQISTGTIPENPGKIRLIKKTIARINTFIHAKKNQKLIDQSKEVIKKTK